MICVFQIRRQILRKKVLELIVLRKFLLSSLTFWDKFCRQTARLIERNDRHAVGRRLSTIAERRRWRTWKKKMIRQSAAIYLLRQFSSIARVCSSRTDDLSVCERRSRLTTSRYGSLIGLIYRQSECIIFFGTKYILRNFYFARTKWDFSFINFSIYYSIFVNLIFIF